MIRFIAKYVYPLSNVHKNRTVNSTEREGNRTIESHTIRSRYKDRIGEEAHRRRSLSSSKRILSELREKDATSKSTESKRSKEERTSTAQLRLSLSLLFYSLIYNPHFWQLLLVIDTSFTDELISYSAYNLSVIHNITQSLIGRGGIG